MSVGGYRMGAGYAIGRPAGEPKLAPLGRVERFRAPAQWIAQSPESIPDAGELPLVPPAQMPTTPPVLAKELLRP
ncbi:hypothetical protein [Streptomyces montanisoli]|uniref:Uncharacterized protein n=1 Tax=Streptomyces montanisoli TaxID=2798581 RepID=A0A940RTT9_9ACTN|nr:hypothetical protein [Streptomyces montanisoli]MBP0456445.1 hypothetical protein [Streptomyces montanisoli]